MTTAWTKKLSIQLCAAAAAGCLGIGLLNQVIAQDDDIPAPATEQPADAPQDAAADSDATNNDAADNDAAESEAADDDATDNSAVPNNELQNDASKNVDAPDASTDDASTDDAAPPDDLNFDDDGRADDTPPALPDDGRDNDRRDVDDVRNDRRDRNIDDDDRISPSDRSLNGRVERVEQRDTRSDVRRFDYDDPSQPIPENQASGYQGHGHARYGHGCHPCGQRVYHNPCGGCGSSHGNSYSNGYSSGGSYQTQTQQPNRPVIGVTIEDEADGVRIVSVAPNSPAEEAGVQVGDRIVAIGGREIDDCQAVMSHIRGLRSGREVSMTVDRDGQQHQLDAQASMYAQVFGSSRAGNASGVPTPPRDRFAQNGQARTALRPNYEAGNDNDGQLERIQMRIGQLERELTALRQEEQDLRNVAEETDAPKSVDETVEETEADAPDITPPADSPTPADDRDGSSDAADARDDSDAVEPENDLDTDEGNDIDADADVVDESTPPDDRESLSPSAR